MNIHKVLPIPMALAGSGNKHNLLSYSLNLNILTPSSSLEHAYFPKRTGDRCPRLYINLHGGFAGRDTAICSLKQLARNASAGLHLYSSLCLCGLEAGNVEDKEKTSTTANIMLRTSANSMHWRKLVRLALMDCSICDSRVVFAAISCALGEVLLEHALTHTPYFISKLSESSQSYCMPFVPLAFFNPSLD